MTSAPDPERSRPRAWMLAAIEWYQRAVEGRPSPCRFYPSCSAYAHEALTVHGAWRGLALTIRRLARCRPFGPSGFDPVPEPPAVTASATHPPQKA
jgi:putative membrane protein insertion efficiency factor